MTTETSRPEFVYVTYIEAAPERVFDALLAPEMTRQFWGCCVNVSDWTVGSRWEHRDADDAARVLVVGTVLEFDRPRRIVLSWTHPSELARPEQHTRVTFAVEPFMDAVRLTVTHENLEPGSVMQRGVTSGWPAILSSLKSLLERGRPLAMTTRRWSPPQPSPSP